MIITTIHIDRFGGLSDLTLRPEAGVNVFFGPNESGKSTAAGFIKFIFYGLPSRDKTGNPERSRALDPSTGSAAGWMNVLTDTGKRYRIERTVFPGEGGSLRDRRSFRGASSI